MPIKINPPETDFVPFTVEIKFETQKQLAAFINLYSDPSYYCEPVNEKTFWTKIGISGQDMAEGVDTLLTCEDLNNLHKYV